MNKIYVSELYHHGIEGMKWGQRNGPPYPLDRTDALKKSLKEEKEYFKKEKKINKKYKKYVDTRKYEAVNKSKKMSNEELERSINRLSLEKKYVDLVMYLDPKTESKEKYYVTLGKNTVNQASKIAVGAFLKKRI